MYILICNSLNFSAKPELDIARREDMKCWGYSVLKYENGGEISCY
jgi:hypothetical protein